MLRGGGNKCAWGRLVARSSWQEDPNNYEDSSIKFRDETPILHPNFLIKVHYLVVIVPLAVVTVRRRGAVRGGLGEKLRIYL